MSLSYYYSDIDLYLKDVLQFLKEFEWIYTTSNTEFIVHGTLRKIPSDWIPTIESLTLNELNEIPFDCIKVQTIKSVNWSSFFLEKKSPFRNTGHPVYENF